MKIFNENFNISSDKINKNYKVVCLSDLHVNGTDFGLWNKIADEVNLQMPDYIFIPGDFINSADCLNDSENKRKIEYFLCRLYAPIFASLGNHELQAGKNLTTEDTLKYLYSLEKVCNLMVLDNESVDVGDFFVSGFSPRYESYYEQYKKYWVDYFIEDFLKSNLKFTEDKYNILLNHSPRIICKEEVFQHKEIREILEKLDLILCGHLHDGSIPRFLQNIGLGNPDKGLIFCGSAVIGDKCRGMHDVLNAKMIVSRGVRKWSDPNIIFNQVDKICAKDITTISLTRKI